MKCSTPHCPNLRRPSPGALYCQDCHEAALERLAHERETPRARRMQLNDDKAWCEAGVPPRPWPPADTDWTSGQPNVTCPVCQGRYHYGAPVPFVHLCPLCNTWLRWQETDEIVTKTRTERTCSVCSGTVSKRAGKYGEFWGCDNWAKTKCKGRAVERTVEYQAPRLELAVWQAWEFDPDDGAQRYGLAWEAARERYEEIEAREKGFKRGWWGSATKLGIDDQGEI